MNFRTKISTRAVAAAIATTFASMSIADVNVAFFLEWATPNQIAKVEKQYDNAMGVDLNWTNFDTGTAMTEAMLAGDIDISYSQGLAPFINAVNANAPIKLVAIAMAYPANECVVRDGEGIDKDNANELEGKTVAVPLNTMADYSFRGQMKALGVDISKITVVDQNPEDAVTSLADGNVAMACIFGGNSTNKAKTFGKALMTNAEKAQANIVSFDVVSVTEKFAQENPELLRTFLGVTHESNAAFAVNKSKIDVVAKDAGMTVDAARTQMAEFDFPTPQQQLDNYFNRGGLADAAINFVGKAFATKEKPALKDYSVVIDTSFLK